MTCEDIKNKIKSVRTMYKKELNLVLKSVKSGAGTSDIYKPKLVRFERADAFLRSVPTTRDSTSNLVTSVENEGTPAATNTQFLVPSAPSVSTPENRPPSRPPQVISRQSSQISRKRKLADINETIDRLNAVGSGNVPTEDEFDHFGKLVAAQLRKMPELDALLCEEKIEDVIRKQRIQIIRNTSANS
ncbi:uncharacterized protein LOC126742436 [Anthonomus grandis grandis]|uniref:uncharacterized protein LOC126742436 n=1 Tax=Anthonomus grandis grandis TaxID=2921223 RepID=UPI002165B6BF|nr:uncharacterized protein LOC126742436 [Anthonomus grandis grandis]